MMNFMSIFYIVLFYLWNLLLSVDANAMLKPSHRGTMWTRTNYNSAGYNYMGINCGGVGRFKLNNGKCGLCGDPYNGARSHETGGKYATGAIADVIAKGQRNIYVKILLNSDQGGYFEFHLCVTNGTAESQACFDKYLLKISEGRLQGDEFTYYVNRAGIIPLTVEVPDGVYCERCVLQWKYVTANTFGRDEHGVGCLGCGHQETYINCADITIKGWEIPTTPKPPTTAIPTTVWWTTTIAPTTPRPPPPPTTTTTTTPSPTTKAPSTTAAKVVTKNTQFSTRYATKHRRPATDFDEGSRRRGQYVRYPNAFKAVPAPSVKKAPAIVPESVFRSNSLETSKNRGIAIIPQSQTAATKEAVTQTAESPSKTKTIKPSSLPKRQSGPFKIPRPPRLTPEQIAALNNDKNVQPGHDPLQKYVDVGSSRFVAGVDFTTVRSQQVATPPTISNMDNTNQGSTDTTVNLGKPLQSVPLADKTSDLFSSFGSEMMGAPAKSPAKPKQNFGMDLINEYGIIPSVSPQGNFVSQNKNLENTRRSYSNNFASNNNRSPTSQVPNIPNFPQNNQQGNSQFVYDSLQSHPYSSNSQTKEQTLGSASVVSSRYGILQQKPKDPLSLQTKQPISSRRPGALYSPETDMFGGSVSQNIVPNQGTFNTGTMDRYGQMPDTNLNLNIGHTYQEQKFNRQSLPTKTTKLPVVDTFTHQAEKKLQTPNIAPWRNKHLSTSSSRNTQDVQDKPVNLFKDKERNKFKAPVVFERFTNYQVGGGRGKTNTLPEGLIKANQLRQQESLHNAVSNDSLHLNTGIHSPEQIFGQDHYITKDVELSNPAFGGPNSPEYQPQLPRNVGQEVEAGLQTQQSQSHSGFQTQQETQQQGKWQTQQATHRAGWPAEQAAPSQTGTQSQYSLNSNGQVQQQKNWHTQENTQSFENAHLNAGLHSPENYFPQLVQQGQAPNIPNQQNNGVHHVLNVYKSLWKPNAEPSSLTTQSTTTTTTTQAPSTTPASTTQAAPTTDIIQYQLNELKRLREKMERLQRLLLERNSGTETKVSTTFIPTQVSTKANIEETGVSQGTIYVPQTLNKKAIYVNPQNSIMNNNNNKQGNSFIQKNSRERQQQERTSNQFAIMKQSSTVPPGMAKETTKYINHVKTQMLQSIKKANEYKRQQMSPAPVEAFQNKQNDVYYTKPYHNDKLSYVTPSLRHNEQQTLAESNNNNLVKQNQYSNQKRRKEEERKRKFKRILELLLERRKQKTAEQEQLGKANVMEQPTHQYQADALQNNQHVKTQFQVSQKELTQTYNPLQKNIPEQSLHHKPALAEMHINSVRREKIIREPVITSVRPVDTIQQPATEAAVEPNTYQPKAVKTTIDKLADRLATSMAEKLSSAGKDGVGKFHVLPLSSDSVMSALRNIAAKIIKSQKNKTLSETVPGENNVDNVNSNGRQSYKTPSLKEVHMSQSIKRQKIVKTNEQNTEIRKYTPTPSAASHLAHSTTQKKQEQTSTGGNAMSPEKQARRKALIRKMKELMLKRQQKAQMTKTGKHPIESSQVRPTESSHFQTSTSDLGNENGRPLDANYYRTPTDSKHQQIISNIPSATGQSLNKIDVHKIERQQSSHGDQNTEYNKNHSPTTYNQMQQTSYQTLNTGRKQQIVTGESPVTNTQYPNNNQNENNKPKVRMSPDIARSMLSRVRSMLAKQKNQNGGENNIQSMSNKDVLVMPLNKEMLFKLLQQMRQRQKKTNTGR